jgi:branched-subunit amino acid ABC-type transport system permease component/ABC-type branched-subunit amino acid transport system substrate-binding protein
LLAAIFLALSAGSCGRPPPGENRPIVIGFAMSLSGTYAASGRYSLQGYQLAAERLNQRGGLLGRPVVLKWYDDKSDSRTAAQLYEKLITEDRVDLLVGPYSSGATQAVSGVAEKHRMAMLCPEAADTGIFERGLRYVFQGQTQAGRYMTGLLELSRERGLSTVAVLAEDTAFPKAVADAVKRDAPAYGLRVVVDATYPKNATDFTGVLSRVKDARADLVIGASYLPDAQGILRQSRELGLDAKGYGFAVGAAEREFGNLGATAEGAFGAAQWAPGLATPGNADFVRLYRARFHGEPDYHAAANYAAIEALEAALNRVGTFDREDRQERLAGALRALDADTIYGRFRVDQRGVQVGYSSLMLQWQGGRQVVVWPPAHATGRATLPVPAWSAPHGPPTFPLLQLILNGLLLGGLYALLSLGMNLVWGVMDVINLAHGDLIVVGGFITFALFSRFGLNPFLALPIAMLVCFLVGVALQKLLFLRPPARPRDAGRRSLLMTFGVSYLVINLSTLIWGSEFQTIDFLAGAWHVAGFEIARARAVASLSACAITAAVWLFLRRTGLGRAVRAVSERADAAALCGVDLPRVKAFTLGLGAALAAAAGALLVLIFPTQPGIGPAYTTRAFAVTAIGGLGSFPGALLGAVLLGLAEVLAGYYLSAQVASGIGFLLFLVVLLVRPSGLLGAKT